ncbi:hypothetical protein N8Z70_03795, partial [Candidatus Puniceispirillum sp.]|nr:hypothetical protein [Candidatus Puniceispirillum sp.]
MRDKEHKSHTAMKLAAFLSVLGICYAVEPHNQLAAAVIGIRVFYFCFVRRIYSRLSSDLRQDNPPTFTLLSYRAMAILHPSLIILNNSNGLS